VDNVAQFPTGNPIFLAQISFGINSVVIEQHVKSLLTPKVKAFFSTKSNLRIVPEIIDLSIPNASEKIIGREDPEKWKFEDLDALSSGSNKPYI